VRPADSTLVINGFAYVTELPAMPVMPQPRKRWVFACGSAANAWTCPEP
jgi:hypothetical protein